MKRTYISLSILDSHSGLEDTDSEVRARALFYLGEIARKTGSRAGSSTADEDDEMFDVNELNMDEIDYIEAFLQVNFLSCSVLITTLE